MPRRKVPTEQEEQAEYESQIAFIKRQTLQSLWDFVLSDNKPDERRQTRYVGQPDDHHHLFIGDWSAHVVWDRAAAWVLDNIKSVIVSIHDREGRTEVEAVTISRERDRATLSAALTLLDGGLVRDKKGPAPERRAADRSRKATVK